MKFTRRIPKIFKNFYLIVGGFALIWMVFFDRYNLISQYKTHRHIKQLEADLSFYQSEQKRITETDILLNSDQEALERFAREEHWMHKPNEDLFILIEEE